MPLKTRRDVIAALCTSVALGLAGCTDAGDDDTTGDQQQRDTETAGQSGTANVRVAHLSPDAPNVDVYVDDDRALPDVSFRTVSDYLELPVGDHTVTITAAGDPDTVVLEDDVTVETGAYTIAAIGELGEGTSVFQTLVLMDDNSVVDDDTARVRIVHASPDARGVDIAVAGGDVLVEDVTFGDAAYVEVPAGQYDLQVRQSGEDYVAAEFSEEFAGGTVYTAYAIGYREPGMAPPDVAPQLDVELSVDAGEATG